MGLRPIQIRVVHRSLPHYDSPEDYMWGLGIQRQVGQNWVISAEYQGIRGIHLLMPVSGLEPQ